nr:zinc finger, CCHC-type [Tanacetum cinerariifolium]
MSDSMFDIYQNAESAKALWESLESKFMAEDASATKFLVSNLVNYKMVDTRPVMEQYHEMDCCSRKGNDGDGLNGSKDPEKQQDAFYVQDDEVAWWVDSGATSHACKDLRWFQVCKSIEDGSFVKMGNIPTEPIKEIGRVLLTFTSGKTLCLDNVLYAPGIQKNLVSEIVLNKCGYKEVLESDKYILSRHGSFVGFGYVCNESKDDIFDEERFTSIPRPRGMIQPSSSKIAEDEIEGTDGVPGPSVPRKSTRTRKAKSFGSDFQLHLVEGTRDKTLSQREYCFIIEEDPKTLSEAMASRDVAFWKESVQMSQLEYSRAIGCLMYAMISTRPDIAFAVGKLKGYSDASWINNMEDHSSMSSWIFLLGGCAISWALKKQTCITRSTMESEFVALAAAGNEVEWLRNLIYEIPLCPKPISTISIRCDSASTLAKAYSQVYNGKSRHLGVRHSMIRELIMNGVISMEFVKTQVNLADHLTKGLARDLVRKAAIGMGLKST